MVSINVTRERGGKYNEGSSIHRSAIVLDGCRLSIGTRVQKKKKKTICFRKIGRWKHFGHGLWRTRLYGRCTRCRSKRTSRDVGNPFCFHSGGETKTAPVRARAVRHRPAIVYGVRLARVVGRRGGRVLPPRRVFSGAPPFSTHRRLALLRSPLAPDRRPRSNRLPRGRQSVYDTALRRVRPSVRPAVCAHLWQRHESSAPVRRRPVRRRPVNNRRVRRLVHERCPRRFRAL